MKFISKLNGTKFELSDVIRLETDYTPRSRYHSFGWMILLVPLWMYLAG
ncbi:MAG: hypothetical protein ABL958_15745 [Bdellovibrionia bacterium]